jgi:hypothetical protein
VSGFVVASFSGGTGGAPLLISWGSSATPARAEEVLRQIAYRNTSDDPGATPRTIDFVLTDGDGGTSNTAQQTVNVTPFNDDPSLASNADLTILQGATDTVSSSMLRVVDPDNTTSEVTYTLTAVPSNGTLKLNGTALGVSDTFTQADIDNDLLTYEHGGADTNPDSFTFTVADGAAGTIGSTTFDIIIVVDDPGDDPPVLSLPDPPVSYTENDPATILSPSAAILELDSSNYNGGSLTVSFAAGGTANDVLEIVEDGNVTFDGSIVLVNGKAIGSFSGGTGGTPLVILLGGQSKPDRVQSLLRNIAYRNVSEDPDTTQRTVDFVLYDGSGGTSNTAQQTVNLTVANDPPVLVTNSEVSIPWGAPALITNSLLLVSDVDNTPAEITYTLSAVPAKGVLKLNGTALVVNDTFTQADIDNELLTYEHGAPDFDPDSFTFTVADGAGGTLGATTFSISILVDGPGNDAPIIILTSPPVSYTENDATRILDPNGIVADVDSADFKTGTLTVSFSAGGTVNDVLEIVVSGNVTLNNNSILVNQKNVGSFSGGTGGSPLVISWSPQARPAEAQAVLRQIGYRNTSESPDTTQRTVDFVLTDGDGGTSNTAQQTINVTSLNDVPTATNLRRATPPWPWTTSSSPTPIPATRSPPP